MSWFCTASTWLNKNLVSQNAFPCTVVGQNWAKQKPGWDWKVDVKQPLRLEVGRISCRSAPGFQPVLALSCSVTRTTSCADHWSQAHCQVLGSSAAEATVSHGRAQHYTSPRVTPPPLRRHSGSRVCAASSFPCGSDLSIHAAVSGGQSVIFLLNFQLPPLDLSPHLCPRLHKV